MKQYVLANLADDMFAGGASPEEISQEVAVSIQNIAGVNRYGMDAKSKHLLKDYDQDTAEILERGFELFEGEASPMFERRNGDIIAVYVESIIEKHYPSLEDIKADLEKQWINDQQRVGTSILANQFLAKINQEQNDLAAVAKAQGRRLNSKKNISRGTSSDIFDRRAFANIFEAPLATPFLVNIKDGMAIAEVTHFSWPKDIKSDDQSYAALHEKLAENTAKEGLQLYLQAQQAKQGVKINRAVLEQIYGGDAF